MIPVAQVRSGSLVEGYRYNDPSLWRFEFIQVDGRQNKTKLISAITCDKYIDKYLKELNDDQLHSIVS